MAPNFGYRNLRLTGVLSKLRAGEKRLNSQSPTDGECLLVLLDFNHQCNVFVAILNPLKISQDIQEISTLRLLHAFRKNAANQQKVSNGRFSSCLQKY